MQHAQTLRTHVRERMIWNLGVKPIVIQKDIPIWFVLGKREQGRESYSIECSLPRFAGMGPVSWLLCIESLIRL